ncbi:MAG: thermonuclease family protein [Alphaproteobacteria bacterium]|nr:thermonuclease family protein [Alphaproteobacteria bacterium]
MLKALLAAALALIAVPAEARTITGTAKAVDSTIIEIGDQRIMLFGVDSVMRKQNCALDGKMWACWQAAVHELQSLLDRGPAVCETVGDPDVYGRVLARCTVDGQSLNEQFVRSGFAVARPSETKDYLPAEAEAKEKKAGLWQGQFMPPSAFRRAAGIFVDRP